MKSVQKQRLMRILIDGRPHREIDLATGVGFTRVATIQKWINSFVDFGYITRSRNEVEPGYSCQLICTRDVVMKLYHHREFSTVRPIIREQPWFVPLFTGSFGSLPGPLPELIQEMARKSHTFFETISRNDTPEKIRETYQVCLSMNKTLGITDPSLNEYYLYYQIYVHAIIRDIAEGGLGEGFADLLSRLHGELAARVTAHPNNLGGCSHGGVKG